MRLVPVWSAFATILIAAPFLSGGDASLSLLSQSGTAMLLGLSYNLLLGQGGMLSFGHAVYSGMGAFFAVHAMNLAAQGAIWLPLPLVPLIGGVAGMMFGSLFGYLNTRKSGMAFAMISLGIAELVSAAAPLFPGFFGGEGGVSANRVYGDSWLGIDFGPQIQVYYLIAAWLFVSTLALYGLTRTPFGRILNAVRDNAERVAFIGYDPRQVRYLAFLLSSFFAGIAGALGAVNFELASTENLGTVRSAMILLFTFIGGTGVFAGPMVGAFAGVLLTVTLSDFTPAWQLYLGLFFIAAVVWAPQGLAGLALSAWRLIRHGGWRGSLCAGAAFAAGLLLLSGAVLMVEMLYRHRFGSGDATWDAFLSLPWLFAALLTAGGLWGLRRVRSVIRAEEGSP